MNVSSLIAVAAGIISVYVILGLITSHVTEWIAALTNQRGALLQKAVVALLGGVERDPSRDKQSRQLVDYLYDHPLIGTLGVNDRLPSYVPPRTFTLSLVSALEDFNAEPTSTEGSKTDPPSADPASGSSGSATGTAKTTPVPLKWQDTQDRVLLGLRNQIDALPADNSLRASLNTLLRDVTTDYETGLKAIDTWFDAQMDRISGAYKRWSTIVQMIIAAVIVAALNADTIRIVLQLVSGAIDSAALQAAAQGTDPGVTKSIEALGKAGLTVGWSATTAPQNPGDWFVKIAGLLLTWFAVLLGAPFWFDILKQLVPVRMAGAKPVDRKANAKGDKQAKVQPQTT